jgi:hypothetical protein
LCLGGFVAAAWLGFGHVSGVPPLLYVERINAEVLRRLGLARIEDSRPADVLVRVPSFRQSLFRAAVIRNEVPVSDVLQVWLESSVNPARGVEQANLIKRRLLDPVLCNALKPWLGEVVIVGGWAHRLYRFHEFAQPLDYQPLITLDTDVAVPKTLHVHEQNIAQRLHDHGFTESFLGDHHPPVTQYRLGSEQDGFYAEFLTPLLGSVYTRDGKPAKRLASRE